MSLLTICSSMGQQTIALSDGSVQTGVYSQTPSRSVESLEDGIKITYTFEKATMIEDPLFDECFMWKFAGFGVNDIPTQPAIPYRIDSFVVPLGNTAVVELLDSQFVDVSCPLSPARPPLFDSDDECYTSTNVPEISNFEGFFPLSVVRPDGVSTYRGRNCLSVLVSPIQYNAESETVRAYTRICYKVSFITNATINGRNENLPVIAKGDVFMDNVPINKLCTANTPVARDSITRKNYLIISTPKFNASVVKFAKWKKLLGFDVQIILKNHWTETSVKSAIENAYNSGNLYYILLVGDVEYVPSHTSNLIYTHVTDFYYSCLDGDDDTTPDLLCGRIPVKSNAEADIVFDKIINYERAPVMDSTFYRTGLHCAYFQDRDLDTYADRRFAQTSEEVRNCMMAEGFNVPRIYETSDEVTPLFWNNGTYSFGESIPNELKKPTFPWTGNAAQINAEINNGALYVLHRDHGSIEGWGTPQYTNDDVLSLKNKNKLPIIFSINCLTGKFNHSIDCFCESFLKKDEGGCVAIFGATESSFTGYNDALTEGMFDAIWPSESLRPSFPSIDATGGTTPTPTYELGQILNQGKARMAETFGMKDANNLLYTKELFHCFGDPSMKIYTALPTSFANVDMTRNTNSVSVSLDGDTATIVFQDLIDGTITTQFGTNATYITSHPANVTVCISAHNKIPFINEGEPDIIYIQNETVIGPAVYDADCIMVGSNVTSKKTQGNVIFNGGVVDLKANRIVIDSGTEVKKGTTLNVINR